MQHLEVSGVVRHIYIYIYIYVIRRLKVKASDDNDLIQLSDMFHFEGTDTQETPVRNFLRKF